MTVAERGYSIYPNVLAASECEALLRSLPVVSAVRARAGTRHLMNHQAVRLLANDVRLCSIATRTLGAEAVPFTATLFDKSEVSNWLIPWHQDTALPLAEISTTAGWAPWSRKDGVLYAHAPASALVRVVALRVHLDDSGSENGPLRVIPGSHSVGVLTDDDVHEFVKHGDPVECFVPRGGVLVMRPLLIHSSSKVRSASHRRVLHIDYADSLDLGPRVRLSVA